MFASVVSNTSLTLRDIKEMNVIEFENLLDGMSEYSDDIQKEINGNKKDKTTLEGQQGLDYLMNTFRK